MAFPKTAEYLIAFRATDTGLGPTYPRFRDVNNNPAFIRLDTKVQVTPPVITELGSGRYTFEWTWNTADDPDIAYVVDGGPSIVPVERRYIVDVISPRPFIVSEGTGTGGGGAPVVG